MTYKIEKETNRLKDLQQTLKHVHPVNKVEEEKRKLDQQGERLARSIKQIIHDKDSKYHLFLTKLNVLSPLNMMKRGYSLAYDEEEKLVKQVDDVQENTKIRVRLQDGLLDCRVEGKEYRHLTAWREENE